MKILNKLSKYLQIGLLLTFFLPFFPVGCEEEQKVTVSDSAKTIQTTVPEPEELTTDDTLVKKDSPIESVKDEKSGSAIPEKMDREETVTDQIIQRAHFLKILLQPDNKYTGIGYIIDVFWPMVSSFGIVLSFLLWVIGLRLKIKGNKIFHILNIIGLILLYITNPVMLTWVIDSKLWGYWFCFWWAAVMIIFDFWLIIKKRIASI